MDLVTKIVVQPRKPGPGTPLFSKKERPDLVLIIYDTDRIEELNEIHRYAEYELRPIYVPAKYALTFEPGWTDSDLFCQTFATINDYMKQPVWFNDIDDLPEAIRRLRRRNPKAQIPEQVTYMLDWPLRERVSERSNGSSIVRPTFPKIKKLKRSRRRKT